MLRRRALISCDSVLPAGYKLCKYLEGTGTQWIDTLITPIFGDVIHTKVERIGKEAPLFYAGAGNQLIVLPSEFGYNTRGVVFTKYFQGATAAVAFPTQHFDIDGIFHNMTFGQDGLFVDGVNVCGISNNRMAANSTLCLFRSSAAFGCARMASFTLERDGQVLMEYIPALDASGKPCMYDTISSDTFYNKGAGEFLYELA